VILICRFAVDPDEAEGFLARARRALGLLTAQGLSRRAVGALPG
jgi:hypothetical protein